LDALFLAGFFKKPPLPIRNGQYISFPLCQSHSICSNGGHPEAQETVLKIALAIPASEKQQGARRFSRHCAFSSARAGGEAGASDLRVNPVPVKLLLPDKLGNLFFTCEGGQGGPAITLAGAALALFPDPRMAEKTGEDSILSPEPQALLAIGITPESLIKRYRPLPRQPGSMRFDCFAPSERRYRFIAQGTQEGNEEDFLYIKYPAVEQGANSDDIPSLLLCATRDAAQLVIAGDLTQFPL